MAKRAVTKDLFGKPIRQRRPRYEAVLERGEKKNLPLRAARVRWLSEVIPKNRMFGMPLETRLAGFIDSNRRRDSAIWCSSTTATAPRQRSSRAIHFCDLAINASPLMTLSCPRGINKS